MSVGKRFHLRLGTLCNNRCVHCSIADLSGLPDRDTQSCVQELTRGRELGCDELVLMRGEPTIRPDNRHPTGQPASIASSPTAPAAP